MWEQDIGENVSTAAEAADVNAAVREECHPTINTYQNMCPKGLSNRMPHFGTIAKIAILTPPE